MEKAPTNSLMARTAIWDACWNQAQQKFEIKSPISQFNFLEVKFLAVYLGKLESGIFAGMLERVCVERRGHSLQFSPKIPH